MPIKPSLVGGSAADGLNVVTIGIENKGTVIVGMIMGSDTRRPIVSASRGECGFVKSINHRSILGRESYVNTGLRPVSMSYPKEGLRLDPISGKGLSLGIEAFYT